MLSAHQTAVEMKNLLLQRLKARKDLKQAVLHEDISELQVCSCPECVLVCCMFLLGVCVCRVICLDVVYFCFVTLNVFSRHQSLALRRWISLMMF